MPVTRRLAAADSGGLHRGRAPRPRNQRLRVLCTAAARGAGLAGSTVYVPVPAGYLANAGIPHFTGGPHPHSLRHGFAVANLRRWAAEGADLAVVLPYLACYISQGDLRGTQYYLRLTADAYPRGDGRAQIRFGYVIPASSGDEQ